MSRLVCWFSKGAASAVATKLAINKHIENPRHDELIVAYIYIKDEHPSKKFFDACQEWFGVDITVLTSGKYSSSVDTVIEKTKYMSGVNGARCTKELKKQVRLDWQQDGDTHIFGMDINEAGRIDNILDAEPELDILAPLIDRGLTKSDCFGIIDKAGIDMPEMYKLGYHNNNCIGCLKATGAGYWNKIRKDFPEVFSTRSEQERLLGVSMCKISETKLKDIWPEHYDKFKSDHEAGLVRWSKDRNQVRIPLRYLPEDAGSHKDLDIGSCGFFCQTID